MAKKQNVDYKPEDIMFPENMIFLYLIENILLARYELSGNDNPPFQQNK